MSRHHAAIAGRRWQAVRRRALDRDGWRCTRCGRAGALEVHHKVALADGGDAFDLDNLASLCVDCHRGELQSPEARAWTARIAAVAGEPQPATQGRVRRRRFAVVK